MVGGREDVSCAVGSDREGEMLRGGICENEKEQQQEPQRNFTKTNAETLRIVYYVKSSTHTHTPHRTRTGTTNHSRYAGRRDVEMGGGTSYEVRTKGWSCSCKAFAFGAFYFKRDGGGEGYGVLVVFVGGLCGGDAAGGVCCVFAGGCLGGGRADVRERGQGGRGGAAL